MTWRLRHVAHVALACAALALVAAGVCEYLGWPFLAQPAARWVSDKLGRELTLQARPGADGAGPRVQIFGGLKLQAPVLQLAAPAWSQQPYTMRAEDVLLQLRYGDLWALRWGAPLRVHRLTASRLDARLERRSDGSASWQLGGQPAADAAAAPSLQFDRLEVTQGTIGIDDAVLQARGKAQFALYEGTQVGKAGLQAQAQGTFRGQPLTATLSTGAVLPWVAGGDAAAPVTVTLRVDSGRARLSFEGQARDLGLHGLSGSYTMSAPSLAVVGAVIGATLPSTAAFEARGTLQRNGARWHTDVQKFDVGRSDLRGSFDFDAAPRVPVLTGKLSGSTLWLADLAPVVGAPTATEPAAPPRGKLLPVRDFNLPSLRAMNADVQIALDRVELGNLFAQPLTPLAAVLRLKDGVLTLDDLLARTADGRLRGKLVLDGRDSPAAMQAALNWDGVKLERWLNQKRADGTAYVTGSVAGNLQLSGRGNSTAALLASSQGRLLMNWTRGSVSHLAVEAAGIDVAQLLGLLIKGDDSLAVHCAAADVAIDQGVARPKVLLVDTRDSTLWAEGSASLADETLDLQLRVAPKDFSPLALRTPIRLRGSFASPDVSLQKKPLLERVVPAVLLGMLHPLAALLPLVDVGSDDDGQQRAAGCAATAQRLQAAQAKRAAGKR